MHRVYIGLGSNLGDREANIKKAVELLKEFGVFIKRLSPINEYEPYGVVNQPRFLNAVVEAVWEGTPEELLKVLKEIEEKLGRKKRERWGPREIDLDILFFDSLVYKSENLTIPHPDLQNRIFVLEPLSLLNENLLHPVLGKTIGELLKELKSKFDSPKKQRL